MTRASRRGYVDPVRPKVAWVRFVCEPSLRYRMIDLAQKEDIPLSEVVRRACREYLKRQRP